MFHTPVPRGGRASMRVLIPIHSFEPGGVERTALRLSSAWQHKGVCADLIVGRAEGPLQNEIPAFAPHILQRGGVSSAPFETFWMIGHLPACIQRLKPDLIFCPGNSYAVIGAMMKLLLGRRCPPVLLKVSNDLIRRDLPRPLQWLYHCWLRLQGQMIDRFVAIAAPMKGEIAAMMDVEPDRIEVIEDGALTADEFARIAALRTGSREPASPGRRFLAVGRLARQKNFALLLKAFAAAGGPDDRLTIVGDGPERAALERLAGQLGITSRLALPGHVHPIDSYLAEADIFVMSSDYEGVPAALIEALAAGLPVIATNCCVSMPMLLDHGALGRLVPVGDEKALASAMRGEIPARPRQAQWRARHFIVERAADAYLRVIERAEYGKTQFMPVPECGLGEPVASPV